MYWGDKLESGTEVKIATFVDNKIGLDARPPAPPPVVFLITFIPTHLKLFLTQLWFYFLSCFQPQSCNFMDTSLPM